MIALDTNILVRYLAQDDPKQAAVATQIIEKTCSQHNPGYVNHIVLCRTYLKMSRAQARRGKRE